jgi:hypothetical protein
VTNKGYDVIINSFLAREVSKYGPDPGRSCSRCAARGKAVIHCGDCGGILCPACDRIIHILHDTYYGVECLFHTRHVITYEAITSRIHRAPLTPASFVDSVDSHAAASQIKKHRLLAPCPVCPYGCGSLMVRDSLIVSGNTEQHIHIVTPAIGIVQAVVAYLKCDNCRVRDIDPRRLYVNDDPTSTDHRFPS